MNENRSFDHYFGTLHGTRGFDDRNALRFTNGTTAFQQPSGTSYELPFHTTIQCIADLNHTWPVTHSAINGGKNDQWISSKTPPTMAYFERADLPYYYGLADAYTICDEYHCSVLSSTYPNRVSLMTGMIDPHSTGGGPEIDNSTLDTGFTWKTYPELLQQAGITWKIYQVSGNNSDNVLKIFAAYKQAPAGNPLHDRGMVASSSLSAMVSAFQDDVTQILCPAFPGSSGRTISPNIPHGHPPMVKCSRNNCWTQSPPTQPSTSPPCSFLITMKTTGSLIMPCPSSRPLERRMNLWATCRSVSASACQQFLFLRGRAADASVRRCSTIPQRFASLKTGPA